MPIDHPWGGRIRSFFYLNFFVGLGPCDPTVRIRRSIRAAVFFAHSDSIKCVEWGSFCLEITGKNPDQRRSLAFCCFPAWSGYLQGGAETLGCDA